MIRRNKQKNLERSPVDQGASEPTKPRKNTIYHERLSDDDDTVLVDAIEGNFVKGGIFSVQGMLSRLQSQNDGLRARGLTVVSSLIVFNPRAEKIPTQDNVIEVTSQGLMRYLLTQDQAGQWHVTYRQVLDDDSEIQFEPGSEQIFASTATGKTSEFGIHDIESSKDQLTYELEEAITQQLELYHVAIAEYNRLNPNPSL